MLRQTTLFMIEKISAVTLRVANMEASVRFYKDVLGLEMIYGGEAHISHRSAQKTGIRF
jgi:catechol 2,3-dioxygenase-like lactoylglutathione lyase family enzyme